MTESNSQREAPHDDAAGAVNQLLREVIEASSGPLPPQFVLRFLLNEWRQYLVRVFRRYGPGREWDIARATTELFLWGVAPKEDPAERRQLSARLGEIVSLAHEVMDIAGTTDDERETFFDALSGWHIEIVARPPRKPPPLILRDDEDDRTVEVNINDIRFRELMDVLDMADIERVEL